MGLAELASSMLNGGQDFSEITQYRSRASLVRTRSEWGPGHLVQRSRIEGRVYAWGVLTCESLESDSVVKNLQMM